jgi:hypothetical protein
LLKSIEYLNMDEIVASRMREDPLITAKFGKDPGLYAPFRLAPVARRSLWDARHLCR